MGQHLGDRKAVRRRLPPRVLIRNLRHQPAQYRRRRFKQVETRQLVVHITVILRCSCRHPRCKVLPVTESSLSFKGFSTGKKVLGKPGGGGWPPGGVPVSEADRWRQTPPSCPSRPR